MRSKILIIASMFFLLAAGLSAQVTEAWTARYDGPLNSYQYGRAVACDAAGNVYVTGYGYYSTTASYDIITVKYNSAGVQQWVQAYNGTANSSDYGYDIAVTPAGDVYVTGYANNTGTSGDITIIKYNTAGVQQWVRTHAGSAGSYTDYAYDVDVDASGNVYVAGYIYNSSYSDMIAIKYNSAGTLQWASTYNGPMNTYDYAYALAVDGSGNVYLGGHGYYTTTSSYDYEIVKFNSSGVQQWATNYNSPLNTTEYFRDIAVDGSGNVYVTGYGYYYTSSYPDYITVKLSTAGAFQWVAPYNGPGATYDYGNSIEVTSAGNVYVAGYSTGSGTGYDFATIMYNTAGAQQWVARYNGPGNGTDYLTNYCKGIALDAAGNCYVTGYSTGSGTGYDYGTVKYNASGAEQWVMRYNGPASSSDYGRGIAVDVSNNVYVTGDSYAASPAYNDYLTIKYTQQTGPTGTQPDNLVKNSTESVYVGDGIYNTDGTDQFRSQSANSGTAAVYHVRIENDGTTTGQFNVTGTGDGTSAHASWTVAYYDALTAGNDITSQVTGSGWSTGSLAGGAYREIRVEVTSDEDAWGMETYDVLVTSTSSVDPTKIDAVRATTTVTPYYQPDNQIKKENETAYMGDDVYNSDGTDQTKFYVTNYWVTRTFYIMIENDDNLADNFTVTGTGPGSGWTVAYFDAASGGTDITGPVTAGGWSTGAIDPDDYVEIRLEVTGSSTCDTLYEILVTSASTASTSNIKEQDAVKAVMISAGAQPDGLIKNQEETSYAGDDVYNLTGMNQTREQTCNPQSPAAIYHVRIQNDYEDEEGNPDVIEVKATKGNADWTVQYFNTANGVEITAQITGTGWLTPALKTREYEEISVHVTPTDTTVDSATCAVTVNLTSTNDKNRKDAVKAVSTYINKPGSVDETGLPDNFALDVSAGLVNFSLPKTTNVSLCVYDVTGRVMATLAEGKREPGTYTARWDAPSGVYFVKLVTSEFSAVRKIAVIR